MAVKHMEVVVCDLCGKRKNPEELSHSIALDGESMGEVCENCSKRVSKLFLRIANPPKRKPRDPNAPKKEKKSKA